MKFTDADFKAELEVLLKRHGMCDVKMPSFFVVDLICKFLEEIKTKPGSLKEAKRLEKAYF